MGLDTAMRFDYCIHNTKISFVFQNYYITNIQRP